MAWLKGTSSFRKLPELMLKQKLRFDFDGIPMVAENISMPKMLNIIKVAFDAIFQLNKVISLPPIVQIEPTNFCNLKCPLCPTGSNTSQRPKGFMT